MLLEKIRQWTSPKKVIVSVNFSHAVFCFGFIDVWRRDR